MINKSVWKSQLCQKVDILTVLMLNSERNITVGLAIRSLSHFENRFLFPTDTSTGLAKLMLDPCIDWVLGIGIDLSILPKSSQYDRILRFHNYDLEFDQTMYSKCQFPSQFIVSCLNFMLKVIFSHLFL